MLMLQDSKIFFDSWNIAWRCKVSGRILTDTKTRFTVLQNNFHSWAADPFIFKFENKTYIFAELFDYFLRRGVIAYHILGERESKWKTVISEPYHLSFPNIFENEDGIFIMPESNAGNQLYIYRAVDFPDQWEKCEVIRENVKYVDTIFLNQNKLLTYDISDYSHPIIKIINKESECEDTVLSMSNPEYRRPAGKMIEGTGIRPAQDCKSEYGAGLVFYRTDYDGKNYTEEEMCRVYPEDILLSRKFHLTGVHTYNSNDEYEVIDVKTRRFNVIILFLRTLHFIKRIFK